MAKSVTIACPVTINTGSFLLIGGEIEASNFASNSPIYTVPEGQRLILKTANRLVVGRDNGQTTLQFTGEPGTYPFERSHVLGAGVVLKSRDDAGGFYATGFLEPDV